MSGEAFEAVPTELGLSGKNQLVPLQISFEEAPTAKLELSLKPQLGWESLIHRSLFIIHDWKYKDTK